MKFRINRRSFVKAAERLSFCTFVQSRWEKETNSRSSQTGALFEFDPESETLTGVATDGHRMSIVKILTQGKSPCRWKLPKDSLTKLRNFANKAKTELVELEVLENWVNLSADRVSVGVGVLEDEFPNWRRILRSKDSYRSNINIEIDKKDFLKLLRDVKDPIVVLNIGDDPGFLTVINYGGPLDEGAEYHYGEKVGAVKVLVVTDKHIAKALHVGLDTNYLLQAVVKMGPKIQLTTDGLFTGTSASAHVYLDPLFITDGEWDHVLMPVRT